MERVLDELSFRCSGEKRQHVIVDADYVRKMLTDIVKDQDLSRYYSLRKSLTNRGHGGTLGNPTQLSVLWRLPALPPTLDDQIQHRNKE